jgi:hypothetical protein
MRLCSAGQMIGKVTNNNYPDLQSVVSNCVSCYVGSHSVLHHIVASSDKCAQRHMSLFLPQSSPTVLQFQLIITFLCSNKAPLLFALRGVLRWMEWRVVERASDELRLFSTFEHTRFRTALYTAK